MALVELTSFAPTAGLGEAIVSAGYGLHSVMQSDGVTQKWYVEENDLTAVHAIIAAHDPRACVIQPYLDALAGVYAGKLAAGYRHLDGHIFQLGPDRLGSTGVFNLSAIAGLCQQAVAGIDQAWPNGSYIRDASNRNVVYAAGDALQVCIGAGAYVNALRRRYWALKGAIAAAPDPAAVDITTGWPG